MTTTMIIIVIVIIIIMTFETNPLPLVDRGSAQTSYSPPHFQAEEIFYPTTPLHSDSKTLIKFSEEKLRVTPIVKIVKKFSMIPLRLAPIVWAFHLSFGPDHSILKQSILNCDFWDICYNLDQNVREITRATTD